MANKKKKRNNLKNSKNNSFASNKNIALAALFFLIIGSGIALTYFLSNNNEYLSITGYQVALAKKATVDVTAQTEKARDGMIKAGLQLAKIKTLAQVYIGETPPATQTISQPPFRLDIPPPKEISPPSASAPSAEAQPQSQLHPPASTAPSQGYQEIPPSTSMPPSLSPGYSQPQLPPQSNIQLPQIGEQLPATEPVASQPQQPVQQVSTPPAEEASPPPQSSPALTQTQPPAEATTPSPLPTTTQIQPLLEISIPSPSPSPATTQTQVQTPPPSCSGSLSFVDVIYSDSSGAVTAIMSGLNSYCNGAPVRVEITKDASKLSTQSCTVSNGGCTTQHQTGILAGGSYTITAYVDINKDGQYSPGEFTSSKILVVQQPPTFSIEGIEIIQNGNTITGAFARNQATGFFASFFQRLGILSVTGAQTAGTTPTIKIKSSLPFNLKLKLKNTGSAGDPSGKFSINITKPDGAKVKALLLKPFSISTGNSIPVEALEGQSNAIRLLKGDYKIQIIKDGIAIKEYLLTATAPVITAQFLRIEQDSKQVAELETGKPFKIISNANNIGDDDKPEFALVASIGAQTSTQTITGGIATGQTKEAPFNFTQLDAGTYNLQVKEGANILFSQQIKVNELAPVQATTALESFNFPTLIKGYAYDPNLKGTASRVKLEYKKTTDATWTEIQQQDANKQRTDLLSIIPDGNHGFDFSNLQQLPPGDYQLKASYLEMPENAWQQIGQLQTLHVATPGKISISEIKFKQNNLEAPINSLEPNTDTFIGTNVQNLGELTADNIQLSLKFLQGAGLPANFDTLILATLSGGATSQTIWSAKAFQITPASTYLVEISSQDDAKQFTFKEIQRALFAPNYELTQDNAIKISDGAIVLGQELYNDTPVQIQIKIKNTGNIAGKPASIKATLKKSDSSAILPEKALSFTGADISPQGTSLLSDIALIDIAPIPAGIGHLFIIDVDGKQTQFILPEVKIPPELVDIGAIDLVFEDPTSPLTGFFSRITGYAGKKVASAKKQLTSFKVMLKNNGKRPLEIKTAKLILTNKQDASKKIELDAEIAREIKIPAGAYQQADLRIKIPKRIDLGDYDVSAKINEKFERKSQDMLSSDLPVFQITGFDLLQNNRKVINKCNVEFCNSAQGEKILPGSAVIDFYYIAKDVKEKPDKINIAVKKEDETIIEQKEIDSRMIPEEKDNELRIRFPPTELKSGADKILFKITVGQRTAQKEFKIEKVPYPAELDIKKTEIVDSQTNQEIADIKEMQFIKFKISVKNSGELPLAIKDQLLNVGVNIRDQKKTTASLAYIRAEDQNTVINPGEENTVYTSPIKLPAGSYEYEIKKGTASIAPAKPFSVRALKELFSYKTYILQDGVKKTLESKSKQDFEILPKEYELGVEIENLGETTTTPDDTIIVEIDSQQKYNKKIKEYAGATLKPSETKTAATLKNSATLISKIAALKITKKLSSGRDELILETTVSVTSLSIETKQDSITTQKTYSNTPTTFFSGEITAKGADIELMQVILTLRTVLDYSEWVFKLIVDGKEFQPSKDAVQKIIFTPAQKIIIKKDASISYKAEAAYTGRKSAYLRPVLTFTTNLLGSQVMSYPEHGVIFEQPFEITDIKIIRTQDGKEYTGQEVDGKTQLKFIAIVKNKGSVDLRMLSAITSITGLSPATTDLQKTIIAGNTENIDVYVGELSEGQKTITVQLKDTLISKTIPFVVKAPKPTITCNSFTINKANSKILTPSVIIGSSFGVECDYGSSAVGGTCMRVIGTGISCTPKLDATYTKIDWKGTTAQFNCRAPSTPISNADIKCALIAGTKDNCCAVEETIGQINIEPLPAASFNFLHAVTLMQWQGVTQKISGPAVFPGAKVVIGPDANNRDYQTFDLYYTIQSQNPARAGSIKIFKEGVEIKDQIYNQLQQSQQLSLSLTDQNWPAGAYTISIRTNEGKEILSHTLLIKTASSIAIEQKQSLIDSLYSIMLNFNSYDKKYRCANDKLQDMGYNIECVVAEGPACKTPVLHTPANMPKPNIPAQQFAKPAQTIATGCESQIASANTRPFGIFDGLAGNELIGWAYDADAGGTQSMPVKIEGTSSSGNSFSTSVFANQPRNDLESANAVPSSDRNHGFKLSTTGIKQDTYTIKAFARDLQTGQLIELRNSPQTITIQTTAPVPAQQVQTITPTPATAQTPTKTAITPVQDTVAFDSVALWKFTIQGSQVVPLTSQQSGIEEQILFNFRLAVKNTGAQATTLDRQSNTLSVELTKKDEPAFKKILKITPIALSQTLQPGSVFTADTESFMLAKGEYTYKIMQGAKELKSNYLLIIPQPCKSYALQSATSIVSPTDLFTGQNYRVGCDYLSRIDCIDVSAPSSDTCTFLKWQGTQAIFQCKANTPGQNIEIGCKTADKTIKTSSTSNCCNTKTKAGIINVKQSTIASGALESADDKTVSGWYQDNDIPADAQPTAKGSYGTYLTYAVIYIDNQVLSYPQINFVSLDSQTKKTTFSLKPPSLTPGTHTISVKVRDIPSGDLIELAGSPKTITIQQQVIGQPLPASGQQQTQALSPVNYGFEIKNLDKVIVDDLPYYQPMPESSPRKTSLKYLRQSGDIRIIIKNLGTTNVLIPYDSSKATSWVVSIADTSTGKSAGKTLDTIFSVLNTPIDTKTRMYTPYVLQPWQELSLPLGAIGIFFEKGKRYKMKIFEANYEIFVPTDVPGDATSSSILQSRPATTTGQFTFSPDSIYKRLRKYI